jgi:acrylyl-CoA reductase (NADPH)
MAGLARVQGEWLVPLPAAFSPEQAMAIGTAGYTAMLCVLRLEEHGVTPDKGPLLVTGASGGVGSIATALLSRLGYEVWAMTGRPEHEGYLRSLGAHDIVARALYEGPARPLAKERWAGAIDAAGGNILANLLAACRQEGVVACCGLAAGMDLPASVAPFILRGVTLAGVESVRAPIERRLQAWERLARDLDPALLARMTSTIPLDGAVAAAGQLLAGKLRGRVVVDIHR